MTEPGSGEGRPDDAGETATQRPRSVQPEGAVAARHVSRRTLLAGAGAAVLGVGAVSGTARSWSNGVWSVGQGAPYELWQGWSVQPGLAAIAAAGMLAANPHNLQPWRFEVAGDRVKLFADPVRAMPINDANQRERFAGFGCAIENMVCAARGRGLDVEVALRAAGAGAVAELRVVPGAVATAVEQRLAAAIPARHSNRGPYEIQPVDTSALVAAAAPGVDGADVAWISTSEARTKLGALYVEATQAIVADEAMSVEAFSWFRNDRADIERYRDGLTLDCQGLTPLLLAVAKILPAQSRSDGDSFWVNAVRDVHTATAAAYGVITVGDNQDRSDQIAGGRLLQRLHLAATSLGLGFQHLNQVTETIARDQALGHEPRFAQRWHEAIGVGAGHDLVAFRIGYPRREANPSPRRALSEVLTG